MTYFYGALFVGGLLLAIYALLDAITTPSDQVRNLPKAIWILLILFFNLLGSAAWFFAGRPQRTATPGLGAGGVAGSFGHPAGRRAPAPPPDDDPEFLRRVERSMSEDRELMKKWEADLRRREEELRGRDGTEPPEPV